VWAEREYKQRADTTAYAKDRPMDGRDPFQALYNRIANDLVRAREKRKPQELAEVREVARLRFAASMADPTRLPRPGRGAPASNAYPRRTTR
jgi:hypothetical protein